MGKKVYVQEEESGSVTELRMSTFFTGLCSHQGFSASAPLTVWALSWGRPGCGTASLDTNGVH